ncbi:argininosuccinate synthase, partial [Patescibacteria group bacterium]|nr:argininosuccinate synthase [Patescibacteria group bacterium]
MNQKSSYKKVASHEAEKGTFDKVLLLYSGGLDTSIMLKWIQDYYQVEVIALTVNIGQPSDDFEGVKQKALDLGAKKAYVLDVAEEFVEEYALKAVKANADYQGGYHLFCPLGRAIIAKKAVEVAQTENIKVIAHGCTGKGNDQLRFEGYITTLDPSLKTIAPVREWQMGREEELDYAHINNISVKQTEQKIYSYDDNIMGVSIEGGEIEEIDKIPQLENIV